MKPVALTMGDPAGIGCEVTLKAWKELREELSFFLIGDLTHVAHMAQGKGVPITPIDAPHEAVAAMREGLPVLKHPLPAPAPAGRPDPANSLAIVEIIRRGVDIVRRGEASALCTNPINKKVLRTGTKFDFPGHTEFLAHLCGARRPVMMLACPELRVVPVTIHIPLHDVPRKLTTDLIEATVRVTHRALIEDFGIEDPRIAIAGLNPHAGEGGEMGHEERAVIAPAFERLEQDGIGVHGPMSADTMFHPVARRSYDVAVCMYHDQALIPIKTLDFDGGVNVTLGLDFVRTSPDHGTAYDIASTGTASPRSLIAALRMAADLGARRESRK
ncbi:4-hydroxythreonine-4-phosphate dehydrogenase PdxA [Amaricoccus macauensis]|uniref:4-hydroxythreonine-4-phosphate dehydrogenase PdxA n=1 Tax=Amaricoccus macauensis TaxID=57001 RepID=UPI003C7CB171